MMLNKGTYVLITAARNEERYIGNTIEAVLAQEKRPLKWVIVSDGSTDGTDKIVRSYSDNNEFIEFVRRQSDNSDANFASKVYALLLGCSRLSRIDYEYLGNLDADITFDEYYYSNIIEKFECNPKLGIGGGFVQEECSGLFRSRVSNTSRSVAGGIQLFRRECFHMIGGYVPFKLGGEDWLCEIKARMNGWEVQSFPDIFVLHHKSSLSKRGILRDVIRQGRMDYSMGSHPLFEIVKCVRKLRDRPYLLYAALRMIGFFGAALIREARPVPTEVAAYLRKEQLRRLQDLVRLKTE